MCSPSSASGSRLVAMIRTSAHERNSPTVNAPAASSTCSQLSNTSSTAFVRKNSTMLCSVVVPG